MSMVKLITDALRQVKPCTSFEFVIGAILLVHFDDN